MSKPCSLMLALTWLMMASALDAQLPARDPTARLREVLPPAVAQRVLAHIAEARARDLPEAPLEQRALKFAARGVDPSAIERSVSEHADRMLHVKRALDSVRGRKAESDELEAGAEALRKGMDGSAVSELARAAPSGRSLAVPLFVLGSLLDGGLPADQALQRVHERLMARASDAEFQNIAAASARAAAARGKPELTGTDLAETKRPALPPQVRGRVGAPTTIPGNAGKNTRPGKPTTPPGRGRGGS